MSFTIVEQTEDIYGMPNGRNETCKVCGQRNHVSNRNEIVRRPCNSVYLIKEWDGSTVKVHVMPHSTTEDEVVYQDGTKHIVGHSYFLSVVQYRF